MSKRTPKHPVDRGAPASKVVNKFDGISRFCRETGFKLGTVHRWLVKGHIDGKYHDTINAAAARLKIRINPLDYVELRKPEERPAQTEASPA